jgi:hemoglobin-like flavoprotein
MALTDHEITLIQSTFRQIVPIADSTGELFYNRLFELDPSLRSMFPADMANQNVKMLQMIGAAVASLKDMDVITAQIRALGARHIDYGVKDEHYDTLGEALLWALEHVLGDDFTPEVKTAWVDVYRLLKATALEGTSDTA